MSNKPVQFKRAKPGKKDPIPVEVDGEVFLFAPRLGTKGLEPISRLESDQVVAMFQMLSAILVERPVADELPDAADPVTEPKGTAYSRLVDLDLDMEEELPDFFKLVIGLYGLTLGESSASSDSSDDDEANSSPTSNGSTPSTSTRRKTSSSRPVSGG